MNIISVERFGSRSDQNQSCVGPGLVPNSNVINKWQSHGQAKMGLIKRRGWWGRITFERKSYRDEFEMSGEPYS